MLVSYNPLASFSSSSRKLPTLHDQPNSHSTLVHELFRGAVQRFERAIHRCGDHKTPGTKDLLQHQKWQHWPR